jgi:thioredoxin 1
MQGSIMSREDIAVSALLDLIEQHDVVFAYFWAPWCAPCQQFSSVYERVANQFPDMHFTKVNVEQQKVVADYFRIQSIPYVLIFKQGQVVYAQSGSLQDYFLEKLASQL